MVGDSRVGAAALPPLSAPPSCAGQPRAMPWQVSSRRTVKSTMASRVASPAKASNATVISSITWRQFGREGGSRGLQGRLTGWCNSRVRCRMPGSNVQPGMARDNRGLVPCRSHPWQIGSLSGLHSLLRASRRSAAWRVGWRRSQGRDCRRARSAAAISASTR
eukprot:scaffold39227_cov58-Phaeocystis_antarctica.AAC.1